MAASVELHMRLNNVIYHHVLTIPVTTCQRFSIHPLTWLRYLGFTIQGYEGYISATPDGPEIDYYQVNIQPDCYYYIAQGEPYFSMPGPVKIITFNVRHIFARP
jgi:hypothetical protein